MRFPLALTAAATLLVSLTACGGPTADLDAAGVIEAIAGQGLPVTLTVTYTAETDPNKQLGRPNGYTSKAAFTDSRINAADVAGKKEGDVELGGSVEVFRTIIAQHELGLPRMEYPGTKAFVTSAR